MGESPFSVLDLKGLNSELKDGREQGVTLVLAVL